MFRQSVRLIRLACLSALILWAFPSLVAAGNREMIENEVREMDSLNKQAVGSIPELPDHGRVDLKADVKYENGSPVFDIYYKKITSEKEEDIKLGGTDDADERKSGDESNSN